MKVSTLPAGAIARPVNALPSGRTADITHIKAEVARFSCSSAPPMPETENSRDGPHVESSASRMTGNFADLFGGTPDSV